MLVGTARLKKHHTTPGTIALFGGGLMATLGVIRYLFDPFSAIILWIVGCVFCSLGAYYNGRNGKNFNLSHHLIRAAIAILITLGAILLK